MPTTKEPYRIRKKSEEIGTPSLKRSNLADAPDYSWLLLDDLLNQSLDLKLMAKLDAEEKLEMIHELSIRLQQAVNELHILSR